MLRRFVERGINHFALHALSHIGDFFRSFVDKKGYQMSGRIIVAYGIGYFLQKRRLAGFRRRDDKSSLPFAYRTEQIHRPYRKIELRVLFLESESLARISRRQIVEIGAAEKFFGEISVHRVNRSERGGARFAEFRARSDDKIAAT